MVNTIEKIRSEQSLQAHCFEWTWMEFPETRRLFFSVPNGGTRNVVEVMQLQAAGQVSGVSDMILLWNWKGYAIEFKYGNGVQRPDQKKFEEACKTQNIPYRVFNETQIDEFKEYFKSIIQQC